MSEREAAVRAFHAAHPGATARAFARTGSYQRLAREVAGAERVLDLACGDGPMLTALGRGIGVDLSREELALARGLVVQARAQQLPFADASFDACTCHLAFMLFDDVERVVAELARVLRPGGVFAALLGGGPVEPAPAGDAFHRFLALARFAPTGAGDRRAKTEVGWRELFAGWSGAPVFERIELELGGTFAEAWTFLGASYGLLDGDRVREQLAAELGERASCRVAVWLAAIRR